MRRPSPVTAAVGCALAILGATRTRAETLADAIALTYAGNPTLQQQRAEQRALDESYVQARAGWRPSVGVQASAQYQRTDLGAGGGGSLVGNGAGGFTIAAGGGGLVETNGGSAQITATQPLYTGGRTAAAVNAAEADILAGRQALRVVEARVLQSVVQAYEDVRRDQAVVAIRRENVRVLSSQLEETGAKRDVGQLTRVDVAQAQAQLANARAQLTLALSQLQNSRATYAAIVGRDPGALSPPPTLAGLPSTVEAAFDVAERENGDLGQARAAEQASRFRIGQAKAERRPTVSLQGSFGANGTLAPFDPRDYDRALTGSLVLNQRLFTGGVVSSQIRQLTERNGSARIAIEGTRRSVVRSIAQAWNVMVAARDTVSANTEQVAAAEVASEGIREQYRVGLSTTLDVLIQEQTLRNAQLALVGARHDQYVAQAALLAAMGRLEARSLIAGVEVYDPAAAFDRVKTASRVPWERAVERLDRIGATRAEPVRPLAAPLATPTAPTLLPANGESVDAALSTQSPTAPQ